MLYNVDNEWLLSKVILCFGLFRACRKDELLNLNNVDKAMQIITYQEKRNTFNTKFHEECSFRPINIIRRLTHSHTYTYDLLFVAEKEVTKKWRNVRDQWTKMVKKIEKDKKAGTYYNQHKRYVHGDRLSFLNKTLGIDDPYHDPGSPEQCDPPAEVDTPAPTPRRIKARPIPAEEEEEEEQVVVWKKPKIEPSIQIMHTAKEEDPKLMFFKGIIPHMTDFNDDENLRFQSGVLQLIQKIRKERLTQKNEVEDT